MLCQRFLHLGNAITQDKQIFVSEIEESLINCKTSIKLTTFAIVPKLSPAPRAASSGQVTLPCARII